MGNTPPPKSSQTSELFPWSDSYRVGIRLIDIDHRNLFEIINTLHAGIVRGLSGKALNIALAGLIRYVDEHFEREENLMREYQYPDFERHRDAHREMIRAVYAIRKIQTSDPASIDLGRLMEFLGDWLKQHVLSADRDYVPYLRGEVPEANRPRNSADDDDQTEPSDAATAKVKTVSVEVPAHSVETLRRCALLLRRGGEEAHAIAEITDPIASMSLDEAKDICLAVLK